MGQQKLNTRHTLNELLVGLFNYILYIEERNLKDSGVNLSMNDVHILENIQKASDNSMSHIAGRLMVTQGTLTTNVAKLIKKGYVERYRDDKDKRIVRLRLTDKAMPILDVHEAFHANMIDKAIGDLGLDENIALNETLEGILAYFRNEYRIKAKI
ncbi:DNA-binding MarR family transcriptional regulator [Breznakia sp. PH1-1]|nr:DNA-binding MarR family transcriptional regulator [Breznakia sp. PH1-1]MDH6403170.1 DNA-binding MarR family transcriptional regulator [Breznakia sp. PF1-11]MDH6410879.1 DNA-binding MarR family transcriptional regulator [Breznakia sp. PFB1-11]MDH6413064.1 DNA-binding MarR family transcriptional regulator [Breznakia sp. PFB1-14]MDH6415432.1 DNA-binding MarR family transcriptional regulator [Breznakia sp. PFB1-4]MDH6417731.1 DNA-binding MarR family transcriptional regulator [Breznakia sp. PFB1